MLNSTFGLSRDFLQYIDKENSYQNQVLTMFYMWHNNINLIES